MPSAPPIEPITADDDTLRRVLADAHLPSLIAALAVALGDLSLLHPALRLDPTQLVLPQGGLTEEQQLRARELILDALIRFRDGGSRVAPLPDGGAFKDLAELFAGGMDLTEHLPMLREELALSHEDARRPEWAKGAIAPDRPFEVVVIGAGMSGILAAHRLQQAGVSFVVLEKNARVGGTWTENRYPGCRVDIASHYYCYSFAQAHWPYFFSPQPVLQEYFADCVERFGLTERIRFGSDVEAVEYDDTAGTWNVRIRNADTSEETIVAHAVISAVGQLNRPMIPDIPGRDSFQGEVFHSAQWRHDVDLRSKRVAIIGTGCSAVQFAPHVASAAASVEIFQRTPNWMIARPGYKSEVPEGFQWLLRHVPYYREWYRLFLFWITAGWAPSPGDVDPDWPDQGRSVSRLNDTVRGILTAGMAAQYDTRPDLFEKVLPTYPPASKRLIVDGGDWADMLHKDHVTLDTTPVRHIDATGITTDDGVHHAVDVIIYGTGFRASHFLTPMKVTGRDGIELQSLWDGDDARAYLGALVPGFPNFFMLYGPNTNLVVSGSIIWFSECTVRYVMAMLEHLLRSGQRALDLKHEVHDAYNAELDQANERRAWAISNVNSWYKNSRGRSTQNWPLSLLSYWQRTASFDPAAFDPV